ncbi:MAG: hypothetical protein D3910_27610 [Candidatus Electrothrix sp. ATG2]|nr:hypothetical protein [Candidatus Electrothrix sp. ATG2]
MSVATAGEATAKAVRLKRISFVYFLRIVPRLINTFTSSQLVEDGMGVYMKVLYDSFESYNPTFMFCYPSPAGWDGGLI